MSIFHIRHPDSPEHNTHQAIRIGDACCGNLIEVHVAANGVQPESPDLVAVPVGATGIFRLKIGVC